MSLYAIGDTHLSLGASKPMDIFGPKWENHAEKLREGFSKLTADDVCVICGDISWGMGIEQCREDFLFIEALPGKKIILKGNHDYWWSTAAKAKKFFAECGITSIEILYNNAFQYQVNYLAQYRVQVISLANGLEYLIDISGRSGEYLSSLYHTDGSLKAQQQGFASDLSLLYPADIAGNGVYALIGYQEISGLYRADALGYMINTLQWQNGRFALTNQMLGVLGTQA